MPQKNRKQRNCPPRDAEPVRRRRGMQPGNRHANFVNRLAADPRLDAEPAARDERAQNGRHVRALRAERRAAIDRKGNSVTRSGVRVQDHRHQHDEVAEKDREHRLPPVHAAADERRREHVSRDARGHGNPQRGETQHAPLAPRLRHRREVGVEQPALLDVRFDIGRVGGKAGSW